MDCSTSNTGQKISIESAVGAALPEANRTKKRPRSPDSVIKDACERLMPTGSTTLDATKRSLIQQGESAKVIGSRDFLTGPTYNFPQENLGDASAMVMATYG
ncbi:hypothetical protein V5O48_009741, partial [Marasmius crinis-equi]